MLAFKRTVTLSPENRESMKNDKKKCKKLLILPIADIFYLYTFQYLAESRLLCPHVLHDIICTKISGDTNF